MDANESGPREIKFVLSPDPSSPMFALDNTSKRSSMISSALKENPKAFECPFETAKDADLAGCSTNLNSRNSDPHTKQDRDQQRK